MCVVSAPRLHAALVRTLVELRPADGGLPVSVHGVSEVEPTAVAALALDDARARAWRPRGWGRRRLHAGTGATTAPRARHSAPSLSPTGGTPAARSPTRFPSKPPLPNAPDPNRRTAWGWTVDARSLTEPTARVLLAVNALTPDDAATRREAVGLLRARQCADGGWNFGNASVYDVDLRGYAQTTAMGLIALQQGHARIVSRAFGFLETNWRLEPGGLTVGRRSSRSPPRRREACPSSSPHWSRSHVGPRSARGPSRSPGPRLRPARTPASSP